MNKKAFILLSIIALHSANFYPMQTDNDETDILCEAMENYYKCFNEKLPKDPHQMINDSQRIEQFNQLLVTSYAPINLDVPWRRTYSQQAAAVVASPATVPVQKPCPFCTQTADRATDDKNYFIDHGTHASTLFNLNGTGPLHFLCIPHSHASSLKQLSPQERSEFFTLIGVLVKRVNDGLKIQGWRAYFNLEHRCAGATIPEHLHGQILAKFEGETIDLSRYLIAPFLVAERQGGYFKQFRQSGDLSIIKSTYDQFTHALKLAQKIVNPTQTTQQSQSTQENKCGICVLKLIEQPHIIGETNNFTVLYNPVGAYPGECFIVGMHNGLPFHELPADQQSEFAELLAKTTSAIKETTGCHGISLSWEHEDNSKAHGFKAIITPRFDNETSTLMLHFNQKINSPDRESHRAQLREKLNKN